MQFATRSENRHNHHQPVYFSLQGTWSPIANKRSPIQRLSDRALLNVGDHIQYQTLIRQRAPKSGNII